SHAGPNGIISSYWKRTGDKISYTLVVPANSTATVKLHVQEGQKIYQNGRLAGNEIKSPSALDTSGHIFSCKVPAGTYRFELQK
ncbi:MAG: alpha-L-rhamnosidase C-terminal domain-containing protein, partial [Bacteroidota bacterium]|nr:alpha-L-rhamnosidase C-terminal domain-containing protein [Bacteroidota bacterium]